MEKGIAGRIAAPFLESKLSLLLIIALMIVGLYSSSLIPREEDPQINVPMVDIMVGYPGASPEEVENRVIKPLEKSLSNIKGVEHLRSTSQNGQGMIIVQYYVGEDIERSYVKLYDELLKNMDLLPEGVMPPLIKSRSINDVPILGLTLWSENYDDFQLHQLAQEISTEIKQIKDISKVSEIGGRHRQLKVVLDKTKMAQNGVDALEIMQMIKANNAQSQSGSFVKNDTEYLLTAGEFLSSKEDVENLIIGVKDQMPIYLKQVAEVFDGPETAKNYISFGFGNYNEAQADFPDEYPAVTLAVAKIEGAGAMDLSEKVLEKVDRLKENLIPADVHVEVTRDYGETASEKVNELLGHLLIAIIAVTILVTLAMGWRGGLVVFFSVPLTFALTLFSYYILGYTLNRITLFALVFVVGIVVDDSIIVAENMHRHFKNRKLSFREAAIYSINEVGNPTILATFTVIAAVLPMAFVSGMMGPYMSPMPIGASIAMLLSLFIALTITPYLGYHLLREKDKVKTQKESDPKTNWLYKVYMKLEKPLLDSGKKRWMVLGATFILLLGSMSLFFTDSVAVKMLPFDNKNEFQLVIDMPEGTTLERTNAVTQEFAQFLKTVPEVVNYQSYVGSSAPITFNGLVRHYDLRTGSNMADIQINLLDKDNRKEQSHDIAKRIREGVMEIAEKTGAHIKVVEVPPGPPVQSTIVAEIYGPDHNEQQRIAQDIKNLLHNTDDVVDIDWTVEAPQTDYRLKVNKEKAMLNGIVNEQVIGNLTYLLGEHPISKLYDEKSADPIGLILSLSDEEKSGLDDILDVEIKGQHGNMVSVREIVDVEKAELQKSISRMDQQRVVYVTADMAGNLESPVYAILGIGKKLNKIEMPKGYSLDEIYVGAPEDDSNYTVKWSGEWEITLDVFRDLGIAFLVVIVVIYMLIVGWFQDFKTPLVMMLAIPFSLVGIVLGHWIMGAYFTATSFIGMIALAGIIVRNSILLIDFMEIRLRAGVPLKEAIIDAGVVRTTPIVLTTGAVIIGAAVILFDPIFQGLAISLVAGAITSTFLTLLIVPVIYYMLEHKRWEKNEEKNEEKNL